MQTVCVIGGTRFFGKVLVGNLLARGIEVTIVTRGQAADPFGDAVRRIHVDAADEPALVAAMAGKTFDAVVHQVCYEPLAALGACRAFGDRAGRFVLTSSMEVYNADTFRWKVPAPEMSDFATEDQLDTEAYGYDLDLPWTDPDYADANYGEAKRQAESVFLSHAEAPVVIVRGAHVLGEVGDFTGRFDFHVDRIIAGRPIVSFANPGKTSLVHADDLARFLAWAAEAPIRGSINACSPDTADVYDVCRAIEAVTGKKADVQELPNPAGNPDLSPYSCPAPFGMSPALAAQHGFEFTPIAEWLPKLAAARVRELSA
jgi:nucleoside-diphosphate-sugar epimerase